MKGLLCFLGGSLLFFVSCKGKPDQVQDAVAAWSFSDVNDQHAVNSPLKEEGKPQWVSLAGSKDDKTVYLDGSSWLDAGQGKAGELKINGKGISIFVRMKAASIKEYNPLLTKSGNDQHIAYSVNLHKDEEDLFIEATLGSDDIGGAHLLKYKLPKEEWLQWHDILFRFNGKELELYIDGILRDNEVAVGDTRDWNNHSVLIGADRPEDSIVATFNGWIDDIAIWNKFLPDDRVAALSGLSEVNKSGLPEYYAEKYRPQFHFTAKKNWLNDPNGLFYYDGTYHLFFQYMPPHRHGAYKDWGHATSTDLVHWEQLSQHITPHKVWGGCWSGSAVVDENNVSGFQAGKEKPIIAFMTNGGNPDEGFGPKCTQNIAYSTDGGKTFTYYDQNPVINNIHESNRDPKVVWDKVSKQWIMSLYMDKDNDFGLFSSADLKKWEYLSTISLKGVAECPGFEALPVDGDTSAMKWLLFGANGNYAVGTFNGKKFTPETNVLISDYGKNFYAGQTWNNAPDGKYIFIAWMPTKPYPGMPFEQQMTFPTELTLKTTPAGVRAFRMPVKEISKLYDKAIHWQQVIDSKSANPLKDLDKDLYDINLEVDLKKAPSFDIGIRGANIHYDAIKKMIYCGGNAIENTFVPDNWRSDAKSNKTPFNNMGEAPLAPVNGKISLRLLVDRTTIEIFGNEGQVAMSSCYLPTDAISYSISTPGEINVNANIHSLKSAWGGKK